MKTIAIKPAGAVKARKPKTQAAMLKARWPEFYEWKRANPDLLALPMPPNMANGRGHWRAKDAARKAYFGECDTLFLHSLLPMPETQAGNIPQRKVRLKMTLYTVRENDWDNLTARCKWAVDWLVRTGYMVDDSPDWMDLQMPKQEKAAGTPPRIVFEIEVL
jgi:hypothetical protein